MGLGQLSRPGLALEMRRLAHFSERMRLSEQGTDSFQKRNELNHSIQFQIGLKCEIKGEAESYQ